MFNGISKDDLFKLMDRLSINEISALVAGATPNDVCYNWDYEQYGGDEYYIKGNYGNHSNSSEVFSILSKVLSRAVIAGDLKANIVANTKNQTLYLDDLKRDWLAGGSIDTEKTTILRDDIKKWFEERGVYPSIFFPNGRRDDYMNPNHEAYSPELAICVKAWEMAQTSDYPNKTPKQFMMDWILANAKYYGVKFDKTDEVGKKKAEELAKIANWATTGGAKKGNPLKKNKPTPLNDEPTPPLEYEQGIPDELKINLPEKIEQNNNEDLPF